MKFTIRLLFFIIISSCKLIAQSDHLEPIPGILDASNYEYEYHSNLRKTLFKDFDDFPRMRILVTPSFGKEYALEIGSDSLTNNYIKYHYCTTKKIWNVQDVNSVEILKLKKSISKESIILLDKLFDNLLKKTKYIRKDWLGSDGTQYYFFRNYESGTTWSPKEGTQMALLVDICNELTSYTQNEDIDLSSNLKKKIKHLIKKSN